MKKIAILALLLLLTVVARAYDIVNITNNDGLSNSAVNTMLEDSNGLLWIGTWDGLNVYNGRTFKIYKPDPSNPKSISNNIIRDIVEERPNLLWIATDRGINRLDITRGEFDRFLVHDSRQTPTNEHSYLVALDNSQHVFAAMYQRGLYYFDSLHDEFVLLSNVPAYDFDKIFFDTDNNLWIYTRSQELHKVVFGKGQHPTPQVEAVVSFAHLHHISGVFYSRRQNSLLLQNQQNELYGYNISEGVLTRMPAGLQPKAPIKSVCFMGDKQWWATTQGLILANIDKGEQRVILPQLPVLWVMQGSQDILWAGTDSKGLFRIAASQEEFHTYSYRSLPHFAEGAVRAFYEDSAHTLWVGTKGGGLHSIQPAYGKSPQASQVRQYTTAQGLANNSVFVLAGNKDLNEFWIGTDGAGINYMVAGSRQLYTLHVPDSIKAQVSLSSVYTLLPQGSNTLWVGTSGQGMYHLVIDKTRSPYTVCGYTHYYFDAANEHSLSNNVVYAIVQAGDSALWIGTRGGGLNLLDRRSGHFRKFRHHPGNDSSISDDDVLSLHKDGRGNLWVGTSMGLNKMNPVDSSEGVFLRFTEQQGMPNNTIHGILEDAMGNIWASTNRGLARLIWEPEYYRVVSYYQKDGLQDNEFSDGAAYRSPYSQLFYFGGINGYNAFDPLNIAHSSYMPPLYLDEVQIDNQPLPLVQLRKGSDTVPHLVLRHDNKSVQFRFTPLDYLYSNKCELSYMLEGYHNKWIQLGVSNTIVFTNLPTGRYTLKVRQSNADRIWSSTYYTMRIEVLPPWWMSGWAYAAYVVATMALAWTITRMVNYRMRVKRKIEFKEREQKKIEEIHQAKLRFFTNIAHEFSNSLTLIYGPCEQLLENKPQDEVVRKYVHTIKSNSERMQHLIQQLIEFRKAETGYLKLEPEQVDVAELVRVVAENFMEALEQNKIDFRMDIQSDPLLWPTDRRSLEKVIFNLLSNAVKYTPEEQQITLTLKVEDDTLYLKVHNTGVGIEARYQQSIFNRFLVLERFERQVSKGLQVSSGIGLAVCQGLAQVMGGTIQLESDGSSYTSFVVQIPRLDVPAQATTQPLPVQPTMLHTTPAHAATTHPNILPTIHTGHISTGHSLAEDTKRGLVLVIDDDKEIRLLLKDVLRHHYQVMEAANGIEAIEVMRVRMPQVIVCDVIMPEMDGVQFVKTMKIQELTRHIPIILLSSRSSVESQIEGLEVGADAYLNKPFHPRHLEALIESLLQRKQEVLLYGDSHYAAVEQYQGKLVNKEDKQLMEQITKVIKQNLDNEKLTLDLLAQETAQSKMQLYRKIKELTQQTPTEYIRGIRLAQAEKLLRTTNKTVLEIMYACGFNNKAYFYREFSKKHQKTPTEYRKSLDT